MSELVLIASEFLPVFLEEIIMFPIAFASKEGTRVAMKTKLRLAFWKLEKNLSPNLESSVLFRIPVPSQQPSCPKRQ